MCRISEDLVVALALRHSPVRRLRYKKMAIVCRCGNPIENVPEHLQHLASWICQKCSNSSPKGSGIPVERESFESLPDDQKISVISGRGKKAA